MTTVLLVEDSPTQTKMIASFLQQAGLSVISVISSEEAQHKLKSQKPDLVIVDVILPGQSGFELCREIKTNSSTEKIPVAICSTKGTEADKLWGSMLGADAYLAKPINQQELLKTVRQLISN
ncbi:MAG: response regulator [Symploca sp. SIO1A3]|nr:response regulator [Symploca sp. SIO1A3]